MSGVPLEQVADYLDDYLRLEHIPDEPNAVNGLQVANTGDIGGIVAAVDASQATIDGVVATTEEGRVPPLLLVHHGLLWDGNAPVTGRRYRRLSALLDHDIDVHFGHACLEIADGSPHEQRPPSRIRTVGADRRVRIDGHAAFHPRCACSLLGAA